MINYVKDLKRVQKRKCTYNMLPYKKMLNIIGHEKNAI